MNELEIFKNNGYEIRGFMIDDEPMFVAKDIAECLGYTNPREAVRTHIDEDDRGSVAKIGGRENLPLDKQTILINESGMYALIFGSKLPKAKEFKKWVTGEVLPSIRKTGSYKIETRTPLQIIEETLEFARKEIIVEKVKRKEIEHFVDTTMSGEGLITFEHATKLLHDRYETNIGRNTLMSILRDNQVLQQNNRPYQRYMNWFKVIKKVTDSGNYDVTLVYEDKLRYINNYIR